MNIFSKTSQYIKDSIEETKKVTWPTKKETKQYTLLVLVISLTIAIYLGLLDYIFNFLLELVIK